MNTNSENPKVGRAFQKLVTNILSEYFGKEFHNEVSIPIGEPAKNHKFDCVSDSKNIVAECKCYTWTETGNIPSAKMGFINEAVFYLSYLPTDTKKIIVMKKATHLKRSETLAEYYFRINKHLLKEIMLLEIDVDTKKITIIKK
jgi:hypothetical protein